MPVDQQPPIDNGNLDARPLRLLSANTLWDQAIGFKDRLVSEITETLAREGVQALVYASQTGNYPPWVRLEAWMPGKSPGIHRRRVDLEVVVDVKPYNKQQVVYTLRLKRGDEEFALSERPAISSRAMAEWVKFGINRGPRPSSYAPVKEALLGYLGLLIPPLRPDRNPVASAYRHGFFARASFLIGAFVLGRRRRKTVAVPPQSSAPPCNPGLVDSWHAVVMGLGCDFANVKRRLLARIHDANVIGAECRTETYSYRLPNGYEERQRLLVTKDQSLVYVHVYHFGNDVFVGWHAHLNWACWEEIKSIPSKVEDGIEIEFRELRPGHYVPQPFDLIDLNSLGELVHRCIRSELRAILKENKIDQDIDFDISRGDRDQALDRREHGAAEKPMTRTAFWSRTMRGAQVWQAANMTEVSRAAVASKAAGSHGLLLNPGLLVALTVAAVVYFATEMPSQALFGQLLLGLLSGSLYALLGVGIAIILSQLKVVNFAHGAQFMTGAFCAYFLSQYFGLGYWVALVAAPLIVGLVGVAIERLFLRHVYGLNHVYGMLVTFGAALVIEGAFRSLYGFVGLPYRVPQELQGGKNLGFMFLPTYRVWVILFSLAACMAAWWVFEHSRFFRTMPEGPSWRGQATRFAGMMTLTYGIGAGLAALAGVLFAPVSNVSTLMGSDLIVTVFAVLIVAGNSSIVGVIITGFTLGVIDALTKILFPEAANLAPFIVMTIVLVHRPAGLFGEAPPQTGEERALALNVSEGSWRDTLAFGVMAAFFMAAPALFYPVMLMKVMCFALFACALNLLLGQVGLLSMGHAMFLGTGGYVAAYAAKTLALPPEIAIISGVVAAAILAQIAGILVLRKRAIYCAMITIALAQMVYLFYLQAPFTGGEDGIQAVPRGLMFGFLDLRSELTMYYVVFAIFLVGFLIIYKAIHSPFGATLREIRESKWQGRKADRYKLMAFMLSGIVAGLAGATHALVFQYASPTDVHWSTSAEGVLVMLIGGIGTVFGPVLGAFVVIAVENYLVGSESITINQGLAFIVCALLFRRGLVGALDDLRRAIPRQRWLLQVGTVFD